MPAKAKLSEAPIPDGATKKKEIVVADYTVGQPWEDGGNRWEIEATVEDGGVTGIRVVGVAIPTGKPVGDTPDFDTYKLKALLKRLYENGGRV